MATRQKIVTLELPNQGHGFGFGVVSGQDTGTVIHSIVDGGVAAKVSLFVLFLFFFVF